MAHKSIYEFTVLKKVTKDVTEETEAGKLTKKVEVEQPIKVVLKLPSRPEQEEVKLVYALEYGSGVRKGLLTNAVIERAYDKDGYIKEQQDKALKIGKKLIELQNEFNFLKTGDNKLEEGDPILKDLEDQWYSKQNELQTIKNSMAGLYNSTAETFAEQKAMLWQTLFLTYTESEDGQIKPFFKGDGDTYEEQFKRKLMHYDALRDLSDEFIDNVADKASLYISLWHLGKVTTKEEFDKLEESLKEQVEVIEAEQESEPKPEPEEETPKKKEKPEEILKLEAV